MSPEQPFRRLESLDAFRGLVILSMIFVNYLAGISGLPDWTQHMPAKVDGYTFVDLVVPGFLFIAGVAIPLSLNRILDRGGSWGAVLVRIGPRVLALLVLGVIFVNSRRFSAEETGMDLRTWKFLAFMAAIGLWHVSPRLETPARRQFTTVLRFVSALLLAFLLVIYRGKNADGEIVRLEHSWWGILGMIGWAYLISSLVYLLCRGNATALMGVLGLMTAVYIGARHGRLDFLWPIERVFAVRHFFGATSAMVLVGVLVGNQFTGPSRGSRVAQRLRFMLLFGVGLYAVGYLLRPVHGYHKIAGTESWALVSAGLCCLAFSGFYYLIDVCRFKRWAGWLVPIGQNALLAYLMPGLVRSLCGFAGLRLFWYWDGLAGVANAVVATAVMLLLTSLATRFKVIVKL